MGRGCDGKRLRWEEAVMGRGCDGTRLRWEEIMVERVCVGRWDSQSLLHLQSVGYLPSLHGPHLPSLLSSVLTGVHYAGQLPQLCICLGSACPSASADAGAHPSMHRLALLLPTSSPSYSTLLLSSESALKIKGDTHSVPACLPACLRVQAHSSWIFTTHNPDNLLMPFSVHCHQPASAQPAPSPDKPTTTGDPWVGEQYTPTSNLPHPISHGILFYSCPNPTVSSTAQTSFSSSIVLEIYGGRSIRLKQV